MYWEVNNTFISKHSFFFFSSIFLDVDVWLVFHISKDTNNLIIYTWRSSRTPDFTDSFLLLCETGLLCYIKLIIACVAVLEFQIAPLNLNAKIIKNDFQMSFLYSCLCHRAMWSQSSDSSAVPLLEQLSVARRDIYTRGESERQQSGLLFY